MIGSVERYRMMQGADLAHDARLKAVAGEFQQIFTDIMVRSMRATVPQNSLVPQSLAEDMYQQMLDSEIARLMSEQGDSSLSQGIIRQVSPELAQNHENTLSALSRLKSEGRPRPSIERIDGPEKSQVSSGDTNEAGVERPSSPEKRLSSVAAQTTAAYEHIIGMASQEFAVDKNIIAAIIHAESSGRPRAQSPAGAKGLMQLMDGTARDMGVQDSFDPVDNIRGGTRYFKKMYERYEGDLSLALAAYNAGPGNVDRYGGVPPFGETLRYIDTVKGLAGYE
ncbi:transglycosylase SLT domain-containing protein [Chitinivibrio alkaliphilus]|uniref:Flagellar rod assembly protein FlgJ n=1 Tax=Chitinivibrio alkaliphilus ACht1 TaxID=1313304 RepID=U7DBI1_9BACT|nr:transglycosylase SLT domain-containing protein [Chitinivibrio alkaliphilus]ERP39377.1 flagellar rod assembly protein FlgJ [Chitinivibrio alkaliphilus ACht1]